MGFSPRAVGDQSPFHCAFTVDGGAAYPLTGLSAGNMAMHFVNLAGGLLMIGTGTWTLTNATSGLADYAPSATDVGNAGFYRMYPVLQLSTGPKAFDPQMLQLVNLP